MQLLTFLGLDIRVADPLIHAASPLQTGHEEPASAAIVWSRQYLVGFC